MVAALFVRSDSHYHQIPGVDAYDVHRNALTWSGGCPVVAHPPCRSWGKLKAMAKPRDGEKELALWAVEQVRKNGGVLEHPLGSSVCKAAGFARPGCMDYFGGYVLGVNQSWWGHRAEKATLLYIVGCLPADLPSIPYSLLCPETTVENLSRRQREITPVSFAEWLVDLARRCERGTSSFANWLAETEKQEDFAAKAAQPLGFITCPLTRTEVENG